MPEAFQPLWLERAWRELGVLEGAGSANNPRVLAYYADAGHPAIVADDVAWCAAFVGAILERSGIASTRSLLARSYLSWGEALASPRLGAITVLSRGSDPAAGHVGLLIGETDDDVILLGGNQSDAVCVATFPRDRIIAMRWPANEASKPGWPGAIFDIAFAHVLEMEGGWSDDPYDPGGPTNLGITLAVYAATKGRVLDAGTMPALLAELRSLAPATARAIYDARYWRPAHCPELAPGLALMHFDAAVNHGVGGAIRFLQQALAVDVDGEIGPDTLSAARTLQQSEVLARYAELRRARYQALPHFWRFGRGWLRRVDATLALSLKQIASAERTTAPTKPATPPKETPMSDTSNTPDTLPLPKWWGHSMTIWGTLITALSTVLPVLGPVLGLDLTPDLIKRLSTDVLAAAQALGGLIGTIMAILGRVRATQALMRRPISVTL